MRHVYRLRLCDGEDVVEEAVVAPSALVPLEAILRALRAVAPPGIRVECVELDPATGEPKPRPPLERALDELLGDLEP